MVDAIQSREGPRQYNRRDCSVPAQYTDFLSKLLPSVAAQVGLHRGQERDILMDVFSQLKLNLLTNKAADAWVWGGKQGSVKIFDAQAPVAANRAVRIVNDGLVNLVAANFNEFTGITMNAAAQGERVYVVMNGAWFLEMADQQNPLLSQSLIASDTNGRGLNPTFAGGSTQFYNGFVQVSDVVVNALHCALVQIRQPIRQVTP